jgi:transposase
MEKDARSLDQKTQAEIRRLAMTMRKAGKSRKEVSEALGVHIKTITRWSTEERKEGAAIFSVKKRGRRMGSKRQLSSKEEVEIQKKISQKSPEQYEINSALWSRGAVSQLIEQITGMRMPVRSVGEYLKRWGYTPQKPLRCAYQQDQKAVEKWIKKTYPAILKQARKENAQIHWADETGIRSEAQQTRGYAPKGKTPVRKVPGSRFSLNMISSLTNQGSLRWMVYKESLKAPIFIQFLERLIRDIPQKIFLILDNLRVHHSVPVKEWVKKNAHRIELFFPTPVQPSV